MTDTTAQAAGKPRVTVEIVFVESWRSPTWNEDVPSCDGWKAHCSACGDLGDGWAYHLRQHAQGVATRHMDRYHLGYGAPKPVIPRAIPGLPSNWPELVGVAMANLPPAEFDAAWQLIGKCVRRRARATVTIARDDG